MFPPQKHSSKQGIWSSQFLEGSLPSCSPHSAGYTHTFVHPYFPMAKYGTVGSPNFVWLRQSSHESARILLVHPGSPLGSKKSQKMPLAPGPPTSLKKLSTKSEKSGETVLAWDLSLFVNSEDLMFWREFAWRIFLGTRSTQKNR